MKAKKEDYQATEHSMTATISPNEGNTTMNRKGNIHKSLRKTPHLSGISVEHHTLHFRNIHANQPSSSHAVII